MGKKAKKGKAPHKENRSGASSVKAVVDVKVAPIEAEDNTVNTVPVVKSRNLCPHLDKGVNLVELAAKDWCSSSAACADCRESSSDRRGNRGKGKAGKKKGRGGEAIWVCLQCGHKVCGGLGLPTTPMSHAVRHAKQARHPVAINLANPQLRWCFSCDALIPVQKSEENGEDNDVISDAVKIISNQSVNEPSGDVEDIWFGGGSVLTDSVGKSSVACLSKDYYVVRGLMNLGNTCFFNSIMQNLLAMEMLRSYFSMLDGSCGPLTASLKKLFAETSPEAGQRNVVNPKSVFGCVCAKTSQFRGYQQQDSHELLRCLLDGLCTEELSARKQLKLVPENENKDPTFVDVAFGGKVSSTVCCLECGHASAVNEPFLDLSLPVPTKKPPKETQHVPVAKKTKVPIPPKRVSRVRSKLKKDANSVSSISKQESSCESSQQEEMPPVVNGTDTICVRPNGSGQASVDQHLNLQSAFSTEESTLALSNDSAMLDAVDTSTFSEASGLQQDIMGDDMSWLDFLDPGTTSDNHDIDIADFEAFSTDVAEHKTLTRGSILVHDTSHTGQTVSEPIDEKTFHYPGNACDDEVPLLVREFEVLLLPFKEESSTNIEAAEAHAYSSITGQEEEKSDFNGFGGLFDELEPVMGPSTRLDSQSNTQENGTATTFCSESDPDEVDDTSPVSLETCLAYFTKPELLPKERGWCCEKCSKIVECQKRKTEGNHTIVDVKDQSTDDLGAGSIASLGPGNDLQSLSHEGNMSNGDSSKDDQISKLPNECSGFQNGNTENSENEYSRESDSVDPQQTKSNTVMIYSTEELVSSDSAVTHELSAPSTNNEPSGDASDKESEEKEDINSNRVKVIRDATKRLLIEKAPPILTIHLKRFSQDARGRLSKLNGYVAFGEKIDLQPYMDPRCGDGGQYIYRLVGIVEHLGTMRGGHYIAYVRGSKRDVWYHASDGHVREASVEEVYGCEAYILFYEKMK